MSSLSVAVTGATGNIGYAIAFRIANGGVSSGEPTGQLQLLGSRPTLRRKA